MAAGFCDRCSLKRCLDTCKLHCQIVALPIENHKPRCRSESLTMMLWDTPTVNFASPRASLSTRVALTLQRR